MSGIKDLMTPQKICQDESLFDFVSRRLGQDVAKYAIDPFVRGICAGDAREISAKGVRRALQADLLLYRPNFSY